MGKLFTLTVNDVLWINLRVTGEPSTYNYAKLEEATFYQFQNGQNSDYAGQSARFLTGFVKMAPFPAGNAATAFIGALAFLGMNGCELELSAEEAALWVERIWEHPGSAKVEIESRLLSHPSHLRFGVPDCREIVDGVMARYAGALSQIRDKVRV